MNVLKTNNYFINNKNSIYVIYGEEDFLRMEYIDKFRKVAILKNYINKKFFVDSINFNWDEIYFAIEEKDLFSEKVVIEINIFGKISLKDNKFIFNLLKTSSIDKLILFIFHKLDKPQLKSQWFNEISKIAKIIEAKKIAIKDIPIWIKNKLNDYNLTIDEDALHLFIYKTEGNLLSASQEIEKLYLNLDNKKNITLEDVDKKVFNNAKYDIFQLSIAWMRSDVKRVVDLIDNFKLSFQEPILLLWLISEDIRTLLKLKNEILLGHPISSTMLNKLRLWADKKNLALIIVNKISIKMLLNFLQKCAIIDKILKGVNLYSKEDIWLEFKKLLVSLSINLK